MIDANKRAREKRAALKADNLAHAEIINKNKADENKRKYGKVYKQFFERGGSVWYEVLTGLSVDEKQIYTDIEYFIDILEVGIELENIHEENRTARKARSIHKDILRERAINLWAYHQFDEGSRVRQIMIAFATPGWANQDKMKEVYRERDKTTAGTGIQHHVDHIIPIVNNLVCGLNNEFNLQVLTKTENLRKSNKYSI